ncbi:MAG: DMT family transporter [Pseudomonadota bacterium]
MNRQLIPAAVALISALLWGLWWIPVRAMEHAGFAGSWAGVAMCLAALPLLAASLYFKRAKDQLSLKSGAGAVMIGAAMILYSASLTDTTVLRAILLFYLAPAWSMVLEAFFVGRKLRWINAGALCLALIGVLFVFRGDVSFGGWRFGDTVALMSGAVWAAGCLLVFTGPAVSYRKLAVTSCVSAIAIGTLVALFFEVSLSSLVFLENAVPLALLLGCLYVTPLLLATLWSAVRLPPTTLSFILTAEILSGVVSAAILLSDPFGWPEIIGSVLVICAALSEVIPARKPQS